MSKRCEKMIVELHGLTPEEAAQIVTRLDEVKARAPEAQRVSVVLKRAAKEEAEILRERSEQKKVNARRQLLKENPMIARIDESSNAFDEIDGILVGNNKIRDSVDAERRAVRNEITGRFDEEARLAIPGLHRLRRSRAFQADVWREMFAGGEKNVTGNEDAFRFAQIAEKHKEAARLRANRAGATIGRLPGHVIIQAHNPMKLLKQGPEQWKRDILPGLDHERTFGTADKERFLVNVYDNITTGSHADGSGRTGASLAARLSEPRVLHFKDADSARTYNAKYGNRDSVAGIYGGLIQLAEDIALMERFGPNPDATFRKIMTAFTRRIKKEGGPDRRLFGRRVLNWTSPIDALNNRWDAISRASNVPADPRVAHWAQGSRNLANTVMMTQVLISSFPDLAARGASAQTNGIGLLTGYHDMLTRFAAGPLTDEKRGFLRAIGVAMDGTLNTTAHRVMSVDDAPGAMSRWSNLMFRLNGLNFWTDMNDAGHGFLLSHNLAVNADKVFEALPELLGDTLSFYGIKAPEWNAIRKSVVSTVDGERFITGDSVLARTDIPNREALAKSLRTYFVNETDLAIPKPGAKERAIVLRGTRPGTPTGEALRFMAQYKMFSVTMLSKVLPNALRAGVPGFIHLAVASTILGYMSVSVKDMLAGREPSDPLSVKAWERSMLAGGGMGILGDVLLNDFNEYGRTFGDVVLGPVPGTVGDIAKIASGVARGDDKSAAAFRLGIGNTPFVNLFYTRQAVNYLFTYHVQEWINPGYLRRFERRMRRENNQNFLLSPSDVISTGGGFR